MIVLKRKKEQKIAIGDYCIVTVVETCRGHVQLGVSVPEGMPVHRLDACESSVPEAVKRQQRLRASKKEAGL